MSTCVTRSALGRAHLPPTTVFRRLKPRVAAATRAQYGFSRRNKIPPCSAYAMGESNPVPSSRLWSGSGSKVNQFVHVSTSVIFLKHNVLRNFVAFRCYIIESSPQKWGGGFTRCSVHPFVYSFACRLKRCCHMFPGAYLEGGEPALPP